MNLWKGGCISCLGEGAVHGVEDGFVVFNFCFFFAEAADVLDVLLAFGDEFLFGAFL